MAGRSKVWKCFQISANENYAKCNLCSTRISRGKKDHCTSAMWNHLKLKHHGEYLQLRKQKGTSSSAAATATADDPSHTQSESCIGEEEDNSPETQASCSATAINVMSDSQTQPSGTQPLSQVAVEAGVKRGQMSSGNVQTLPTMFDKKQAFRPGDKRANNITRLIAEMICLDSQPLSLVENKGFRRLVNHLEGRYTIPSRKHFAQKIIPDMYERERERVSALLQKTLFVGITTDMWTSTCSDDYLSLTVHSLDEDFNYHHLCLECIPFVETAHTARAIESFLSNTLQEWDLTQKVVCIMRDNGANIVAALNLSGFKHLPCLAHTFQLVVKDGLLGKPEIMEILSGCRAIVGHFKHSPKAMKVLRAAQGRINLPQHRLIQDEPTRWNSQLHMLARLLEQREAVMLASVELKYPIYLSNRQWGLIADIVQLLEIFDSATLTVSSSNVTISEVIPLVNITKRSLESIATAKGPLKSLRNDLISSLSKRYLAVEKEELYAVATLLDPRFKGTAFFNKDNLAQAKTALSNAMATTCEPYGGLQRPIQQHTLTGGAGTIQKGGMPVWTKYQEFFGVAKEPVPANVSLEEELAAYLAEEMLPPSADIFQYWKDNIKYPHLRILCRKYLVSPPSTVFSERLFSSSGLIVGQRRSRLDPERVRMLVFLNKNLQ